MKRWKMLGGLSLALLLVVGLCGVLAPATVDAAIQGPPGGCNCAPTIEFKDGTVCTLIGGCNEPTCYYYCPISW